MRLTYDATTDSHDRRSAIATGSTGLQSALRFSSQTVGRWGSGPAWARAVRRPDDRDVPRASQGPPRSARSEMGSQARRAPRQLVL
jgi:hypothetical protein